MYPKILIRRYCKEILWKEFQQHDKKEKFLEPYKLQKLNTKQIWKASYLLKKLI